MHGNPWLRLLRREVEALVKKKHGDDYLKEQQAKTELEGINRELKRLKTRARVLEERKAKLMADLDVMRAGPPGPGPAARGR